VEDIGVSQVGQEYGRVRHREVKIKRCAVLINLVQLEKPESLSVMLTFVDS